MMYMSILQALLHSPLISDRATSSKQANIQEEVSTQGDSPEASQVVSTQVVSTQVVSTQVASQVAFLAVNIQEDSQEANLVDNTLEVNTQVDSILASSPRNNPNTLLPNSLNILHLNSPSPHSHQ